MNNYDSQVQCSYCKKFQCVDKQIADMERQKKDLQETHCNNCGMVITVVMTMYGAKCLEVMLTKNPETK